MADPTSDSNPTPLPPPPAVTPPPEADSSTLTTESEPKPEQPVTETKEPEQELKPEPPVTEHKELPSAPLQQEESETDAKGNPTEEEEVVVVAENEDEQQHQNQNQNQNQNKILSQNLVSFKEESNRVSDLSDSERNSLSELKSLLTESLKAENQTEVSIWGIPLLKDERTDVILLKFLRAREFKVKESHTMINNTLKWRKDFNIDALLDEDLGDDLEKVVFMHGFSREGHAVCYNVYGEFQNKELYDKAFSSEERREKFLRWRIQFLERSIRKLDFNPGGINTVFQVNDLKNSPGPAKRELRIATKQALQLLQDNYPEFVNKQVFINVPWWYLAFYTMINPFLTQRTKSKFVFAGPSKSPDTLFKYISPEQVPVQYGGLSVDFCDCNPDFSMSDAITEIPIKPTTKQIVEIAIYEKCVIVWELRVVGWEVTYSAEFKPDAKDGYTIIMQKPTKMSPTDEPVISSNFKVSELGKLLLTVDNPTLKKKRLLYRFKIKPYSD